MQSIVIGFLAVLAPTLAWTMGDMEKCTNGDAKSCEGMLFSHVHNYPEFEKTFRQICKEPKAGIVCKEIKVKNAAEADKVGRELVSKDRNASYNYFDKANPTSIFFTTRKK